MAILVDQRQEPRHSLPDRFKQYITLRIKQDHAITPATIGNFSRNGILFEAPVQFSIGDRAECLLKADLIVIREITFGIEVKYCYANRGSYITGAHISRISEEAWFDMFEEIFDYVVVRQGAK